MAFRLPTIAPSFRSKSDRSASAGFVFRSELPVTSRWTMAPFMPHALRVKRSLDTTIDADGGLLAYELVANVSAKKFTVSSAWRDEASFAAWVGTDVHRSAMSTLGPKVSGGTFETETIEHEPTDDPPLA
ncbi:MAG: antibiotic biosynthesis monooxygenase [Ilumatobacter sp.]|uniref:antibiotic biosynthesis monooxygenase n=1 Tax=Ilumatobacter sp. TaxID=1967498 RepID=UPI003918D24E